MPKPSFTKLVSAVRQRELFQVLAIYIVGAWVVLQAMDLAFPGWGVPESAIRYIWIGAFALFPVAVIIGWRYDLSLKGLSCTVITDGQVETAPLRSRDYVILATMALATVGIVSWVGYAVMTARGADTPAVAEDIPENSIAVLPFVNMSDSAENEFFSDGISEELLNELARVPGLHVAARTSAFYYKGKDEAVQKIGAALGVRNVLEGSVRRQGEVVRITAQLIDARNGYHVWSQTYDRDLTDIFAVQTEIAAAIVETLKIKLMPPDRVRLEEWVTNDFEAYELYLRGVARRRAAQDAEALNEAANLLLQALDRDPAFVVAETELAKTYLFLAYYGEYSIDEAVRLAQPLFEKALATKPDLEQAHAGLGLMHHLLQNYDEANRFYEEALRINPNYFSGRVNYGLTLVMQSRLKEASIEYLRAQSLDPMNANLNRNLGLQMMLTGQYGDGLEFVRKALEIKPDYEAAKSAIVAWQTNYGHLAEAIQFGLNAREAHPDNPSFDSFLVNAYGALDMQDRAAELLAELEEKAPKSFLVANAKHRLLYASGDIDAYRKFGESMYARVDAKPGDDLPISVRLNILRYGIAQLLSDERNKAVDTLFWAAGGEQGIATTKYDFIHFLKYLALAYRDTGRPEDAMQLLDQCLELIADARENGWSTPYLFVRLAEVQVLRRDFDSGLAALRTAVDKGWRGPGYLRHNILFAEVRDHPEFIRLQQIVEADVERQRKIVESIDIATN